MSEFTVLLLYDERSRRDYRDSLAAMLLDAGARLREVDASPRPQPVVDTFDALVPDADVILVDVSHHNTNIGIEIGRHMLHRDARLVPFHCDSKPFSADSLPFYLRSYDVAHLDPGVGIHEQPNDRLFRRILDVGHRQAASPLDRFHAGPESDEEALRELHLYSTVLKSPAAAFFFGEFAVTVGHPALYLPLPLYVYVGIRELGSGETTRVKYRQESDRHPAWIDLDVKYRSKIEEALEVLAPTASPLEIAVWSQAPTMCGLATSSAIAACVACYLHRRGLVGKSPSLVSMETAANVNLLGGVGVFDKLFRTAWKIDLCFHSLKGSGAGSFASLCGTSGPNPVLFLSAARKMWKNDIGRHGWELGPTLPDAYAAIDSLPCWGFRLAPPAPNTAFKPMHFALVFTGEKKATGPAMDSLASMSRYFLESPAMVRQIVQAIRDLPAEVRYEIRSRVSDEYLALLNESISGTDSPAGEVIKKHSAVTQEALLTAYGAASMLGMNSYWSKGDFSYLALMETCQSLLEVLGVAGITPPGQATTWEPYALAQHLNCTTAADGSRVFGAKITGGGTGGDLLVASRFTESGAFERALRHALLGAREAFDSQYRLDFGKVHFSSTWLPDYPNGYECRGTHFLR